VEATDAITQVDEERFLRGATAELARVDAVDGGGVTGEVLGRAGLGTWRRSGGRRARRSCVEPPPGSPGETRQPLAGPARLSLAMGIAWTRREITVTTFGNDPVMSRRDGLYGANVGPELTI
jgi:hypothetical protein